MAVPNLFIVGAPKCGTTSMHDWLGQHPEVFMSAMKEPSFFGRDILGDRFERGFRQAATLENYLRIFAGAGKAKAIGESTPLYLYSETAPQEIHALAPDARIIIMLRDPVAQMYSMHQQLYQKNGFETVRRFEKALALEPARLAGRHVPRNCPAPIALAYRRIASPSKDIARFQRHFGADQVFFATLDAVKHDAAQVYHDVCGFLGIDDQFTPQIRRENVASVRRNVRLQRWLTPDLRPAPWWGRFVRPQTGQGIADRIVAWNTKPGTAPQIDAHLERRLRREMASEVAAIGRVTGLDVTAWLPRPA